MSKFWDWLNQNPGAYGADSFEGSVSFDPQVVTPIDSLFTGKPVDQWNSGVTVSGQRVFSQNSPRDFSGFANFLSGLFSGPDSGPGSGSGVAAPVNLPEYINADLAKHYGMDVATAYQEALANTAHQREIRDLQAAGLNPVLSSRYSGSSGVSGASVMNASGGSGSGSGSSDGPLAKLLSGAGLLAGIVAGIATKNPQVTSSVASASKLFADLFK